MDKAELILFGLASYFAIQSLVSLMGEYRQQYKQKLANELAAAPKTPSPSTHGSPPANASRGSSPPVASRPTGAPAPASPTPAPAVAAARCKLGAA